MKFVLAIIILFFQFIQGFGQEIPEVSPSVKFLRIYGGDNELLPPVVLLSNDSNIETDIGSEYITIEIDVDSRSLPGLYAKFIHCDINWNKTENAFINNQAFSSTSNIDWVSAPVSARNYTYRGHLQVPNSTVQFKYPGNWKVLIYEDYDSETPLAEGRFFVFSPKIESRLAIYSDMYEPDMNVTSSAFNLELITASTHGIIDNRLSTVTFYRNNRWNEPYVVSSEYDADINEKLYRYRFDRNIGGFSGMEKRFNIRQIPAENGYRILDMANLAEFPRISDPVRIPFSDLRRTGSFLESDDDGAMYSGMITHSYDEYVYVEFVLDPDGLVSRDDVYVSGSFNNWKPDRNWRMFYDEESRLYILRQWVRRARHNYLYFTGRYNERNNRVERLSTDEYEGNTVTTRHTWLGFVYYKEIDFGGYYSLIGIAWNNLSGTLGR